jgi:hypothetical protein
LAHCLGVLVCTEHFTGQTSDRGAARQRAAAIGVAASVELLELGFFDAFGRREGSALWTQTLRFPLIAGLSVLMAILSIRARIAEATQVASFDNPAVD